MTRKRCYIIHESIDILKWLVDVRPIFLWVQFVHILILIFPNLTITPLLYYYCRQQIQYNNNNKQCVFTLIYHHYGVK